MTFTRTVLAFMETIDQPLTSNQIETALDVTPRAAVKAIWRLQTKRRIHVVGREVRDGALVCLYRPGREAYVPRTCEALTTLGAMQRVARDQGSLRA